MPEANNTQHFTLPVLMQYPSGWGPPPLARDTKEVPYAPFSKSDRLGKVADWTVSDSQQQTTTSAQATRSARFRSQQTTDSYGSGTADMFSYTHAADEEASFSVVDRAAAPQKPRPYGQSRNVRTTQRQQQRGAQSQRGGYARQRGAATSGKYGYGDKPQRLRDASVPVEPDWNIIEEIDFSRLNKLSCDAEEAADLAFHGSLNYFNKEYDRVTVKQEKPMRQFDRTFHYAGTMEDPILLKLSKKVEGPAIFVTSTILSTIMCTPRSVYPWDVVITKEGEKIYIDKRADSMFDLITVNENAGEPPIETTDKETINTPAMLAQEATYINRNFSLQVLKEGETVEFENPNPFYDSQEDPSPPAPVLYRYRQFQLDDTLLVVRTQLDAAVNSKIPPSKVDRSSISSAIVDSKHSFNDTLFATVRALNEFDPKAPGAGGAPEWRQKLDTQRGAVMATELKNNGNKLAKWGVESILAGAEQIRIGFVSRSAYKDRHRHSILGVGSYKPAEFVTQMGFNLKNGWGIVKCLVDLVREREDGKFMLVRDPNRPIIRLYQLPAETFDAEFAEEYERAEGGDE